MTRDSHDSAPTLADDALLTPFRESDDPVLTAEEVSDAVPFGGGLTAEGLERLADAGVLDRKAVGGSTVWWLPGYTETDERRGPMPGATREYEGGLSRGLENAISTLEVSDERERAAVYAVCYYLSEYGPATADSLKNEVFPEHPAGYDDEERWWNTCVRPALETLPEVERDGVTWRLDRTSA